MQGMKHAADMKGDKTYFFLDIIKRKRGWRERGREPGESDYVSLYRRVLQRETACLKPTSKIVSLSIDASLL